MIVDTINAEERRLAVLIVETLDLEFDLGTVEPNTALYEEGFGLDSIDILEVALVVSQRYGVALHADDENNVHIFKSLRSLSDYIQEHRTK